MINSKRLEKTFVDLVSIPGMSKQEGKIAKEVIKRLKRLGAKIKQDRKVLALGYPTGNIVASLPGKKGLPRLMLCAHLDTVGPADKIEFRKKGSIIEATGKSILGADCRSGIAAILEVVEHLKETDADHPPLEIVFTVGEEVGLIGAKNIDRKLIAARQGIVLDAINPLELITAAPAAYRMNYTVKGREAHAGINPEQGVNAIRVASMAVAAMKLGRINKNTTANIGIIKGGSAANIVPAEVCLTGEARSHNPEQLERQVRHMQDCLERAIKQNRKKIPGIGTFPQLEKDVRLDYPAMKVPANSKLVAAFKGAGRKLKLEVKTKQGGGGSDANIFNSIGIQSVIVGTGMDRVHTTGERINLKQFNTCAKLVAGAVEILSK